MKRVLVVDDVAFMRTSIRKMIEEDFTIVGEAENGEVAVEQYKKLRPDIVIMDITMPVMNGIEATKAIFSIDPKAIIIITSETGQDEYVKDAINIGVKGFILKPLQAAEVLQKLRQSSRVF